MPTTLEEIRLWIANHDGRIDAWWHQQHEWNRDIEDRFQKVTERLSALERKVMYMAGLAAAGGAIVGQQIPNIFG